MHLHTMPGTPEPEKLLEKMSQCGVSGGAVFSIYPEGRVSGGGMPYDERIKNLLDWCKGNSDLYPVLFIHPDEKDVCEKARDAAEQGVVAFKMICDNYYVSDPKPMKLINTIAELKKPIIFHSGIIWNGGDSSKYNLPRYWEALISIPGLKFSLAHCSWPWIDECLAVYGKFLNGYVSNPKNSAEMFMDITPGTPVIYRKELLTKLFTIGYDVPHNIMFGTDCRVNNYKSEWTQKWIDIDNKIYEELGVPESIKKLIYADNFLRFIGKKEDDIKHLSPVPDAANTWTLTDY